MKVSIEGLHKYPYTRRLNENLIRDEKVAEKVQQEIDSFFLINDTGKTSETVLWETFKAYIRGVLIAIGARRKKESLKKKENLIVEIHKLEQAHKAYKGKHRTLLHQLIIKKELKDILESESNRILNKHVKDSYW